MRYNAISTLHYKRGGGNKKEGRHGPWMRSVVGTVVGMSFFEGAVAIDSELNLTQSKSTHTALSQQIRSATFGTQRQSLISTLESDRF